MSRRLLLFGMAAWLGCGPDFPPSWLIAAEPPGSDGQPDASGQLRVLSLQAEPPESTPGSQLSLRSLVVTHPRAGLVATVDGVAIHTPQPVGLSALFFACQEQDGQAAPEPCGLEQSGSPRQLESLPTLPMSSDGPVSALLLPTTLAPPYSRLVTMVVADGTVAGGAQGCFDQARGSYGVVQDPHHCVIALKRVRAIADGAPSPNHNPAIAALLLGDSDATLGAVDGGGSYPQLDPATSDDARPQLRFAVERAADAVEVGSDSDGNPRRESLSASFFVTAGTLEAGRGSFLDLGCSGSLDDCPQLLRSSVGWQPPAALASLEAPEGRVFLFAVLRDDRGGVSYRQAMLTGR